MKFSGVIAVAVLAASSWVALPAIAQENTSQQCPKMQFIVVKSTQDSTTDTNSDQGFLGEVVSPVVDAANSGKKVDKSGGFTQTQPSSTQPSPSQGIASAVPTTSTTGAKSADSWKPNVWGNTSTTAAAPSSAETQVPHADGKNTTEAKPTGTNTATTANKTTTSASNSESPSIGRTYVNIDGVRSGAFIPGVHSEKDQSWREKLEANKKQVNAVAKQVIERCPDTKVAFIGQDDGAAVVSEIARDIGAGKGEISADQVSGVATFADPTRSENQPTVASGADKPAARPGTTGTNTNKLDSMNAQTAEGAGVVTVAEQSTPGGYGKLSDRTVSWCVDGDVCCGVKKAAPLTRLVEASNKNINFERDPQGSVRYVADVLGPAVALAGVESLAKDLDFGSNGFTFKRAQSSDETLIGRITENTESDSVKNQTDTERRLVASGQQLGGMALAAGITVAKKVLTPSNIAQIAAAATLDPMAGATVAGVKIIEASTDLFTPQTATTGAVRLLDEATASGVEVPEVAEAAVTTVVSESVGQAAYKNQVVTDSGQTPASATTRWLSAMAADELGQAASPELVAASNNTTTSQKGATFDRAASKTAMESLKTTDSAKASDSAG